MTAIAIRHVNMNGLQLQVSEEQQSKWFWDQVNASMWEQDTIKLLDERITNETLYIDIGTWIGPTVLKAGSKAARVVAVDPDAVAMSTLVRNVDLNPSIAAKVEYHNYAVSGESGVLELWAYNFGDSMTSLLPNRGARKMTFLARSVSEFLDSVIGDEQKVFIKVDIEGGEYGLIPQMCAYLNEKGIKAELYVSIHASFLVDENRTPASWIANLKRNAILLDALSSYGIIHTYESDSWTALADDPKTNSTFRGVMELGGLDTTLYVTPK